MYDDFRTSDEVLAFIKHLQDRELEDTAANRATWFAARDFFDHPTDEGDSQGQEATVSSSDFSLRHEALAFAVQHSDGLGASSIVMKAEAFLKFLQTGESEEAPTS